MDATFGSKFDRRADILSLSFSLSKHVKDCQHKQCYEFKLRNACLEFLRMEFVGLDIPIPKREEISQTDDVNVLEFELDSFEQPPMDGNLDTDDLSSFCFNCFDVAFTSDIIVRMSTQKAKRLAQKLVTYISLLTLNKNINRLELSTWTMCKSISSKIECDHRNDLNL